MPLASDASRQREVLGHESDTIGVNGAEVRILKQIRHEGFSGLLDGQN